MRELAGSFFNRHDIIPTNGSGLCLLVSKWFQVLFHSPHRGTFHLSFTVLVRYRSARVFSLGWWSSQIPTKFCASWYLGTLKKQLSGFAYKAFTLFGCPFQNIPLPLPVFVFKAPQPSDKSEFRLFLFRSPLLKESQLFSFPPGTLMFHFPECPHAASRRTQNVKLKSQSYNLNLKTFKI